MKFANSHDELIVSLTSVSFRIDRIRPVLRSILEQKNPADRVIIYLSKEPYLLDKGVPRYRVPTFLNRMVKSGKVELCFTKNTGPYRKLLPVLKENFDRNVLIVTADDDTVYPRQWLGTLVEHYNRQRCDSVAFRGHSMVLDEQGKLLPYTQWPEPNNGNSIANFATGKDGILYSPRFFDDWVFNTDFLKICPLADDIWFKFLLLRNQIGTTICNGIKLLPEAFESWRNCLWRTNVSANDTQLDQAIRYFDFDLEELFQLTEANLNSSLSQ